MQIRGWLIISEMALLPRFQSAFRARIGHCLQKSESRDGN